MCFDWSILNYEIWLYNTLWTHGICTFFHNVLCMFTYGTVHVNLKCIRVVIFPQQCMYMYQIIMLNRIFQLSRFKWMCLRGPHRKGVHVFTYRCTSMNISLFLYIFTCLILWGNLWSLWLLSYLPFANIIKSFISLLA